MRTTLVTGDVGFIGSVVMRKIIQHTADCAVVVDKLTYTGNLMSLAPVAQDARFASEQVDICDRGELDRIFRQHQPDTVMHLAAEGHTDRSIDDPMTLAETDILGTYTLLEVAHSWRSILTTEKKSASRFHRISTDRVYGDLHGSEDFFTETTPYASSNPYSISKASSNHLVRAWLQTYDLSTPITNCSSDYDPYHFPEKLILLTILDVLVGKPLPAYNSGQQIRDWPYMEDHTRTLYLMTTRGESGETYSIGGYSERKNIEVVGTICQLLKEPAPHKPQDVVHYHDLITFVADRPDHGLRYAINTLKIARELDWAPAETFASGVRKTVAWYLVSENW